MSVSDEIRERARKLRAAITSYRTAYHERDESPISPEALDSLKRELSELEEQYPELVSPESPTRRIAGKALPELQKVRHTVAQWSLDDAFEEEDLRAFDERVRRGLERAGEMQAPTYACELKIDGLHIVLTYEKGKLVTAATRGDGVIGEDVTHTIRTIEDVPEELTKPVDLVVEGEVYMSKKGFEELNERRKRRGEPLFANPRNVAAGSVRQLDPKIAAERPLRAFIYDIGYVKGLPMPDTQSDELALLKKLGLPTNGHSRHADDIEEVLAMWKEWGGKQRERVDYLIDGIVVKVEERKAQEALGYKGKGPRYAIALKFAAEQVTTILEDIGLQIGRTGKLTPVAHLVPVSVAGSTVARATLHNEDFIKEKDIRIGDTVIVQKAGDVIPEIVGVLVELRSGKEKAWHFPKSSPLCGGDGKIERVPGEAAHRCAVRGSYAEQALRLAHFAGKTAFDIDGFGEKTVELLMKHELLSEYDDIFELTEDELAALPGMGEISAMKLLAAIDEKRKVPLNRFLVALSIDHVGEETALLLAQRFNTLMQISQVDEEDLLKVKGIGEIVAKAVTRWFRNEQNKDLLRRLKEHVTVERVENPKKGGALEGQTVVVTGTLEHSSRDEAKALVQKAGGTVSGTVSKKTTFVLAGENPGSKFDTAKKLGVPIVSEREFRKRLGL